MGIYLGNSNLKSIVYLLFSITIMLISTSGIQAGIGQGYYELMAYDFFVTNNIYSVDQLLMKNILSPDSVGKLAILEDWETTWFLPLNNSIFKIAYIEEFEQRIQATEESLRFLYDLSTIKRLTQNQYHLSLNTWSQFLRGIACDIKVMQSQKPELNLAIQTKLLRGVNLIERHYQGDVDIKKGEMSFAGTSSIINSEVGKISVLDNCNFHSQGYSIGFSLDWQINHDYLLSLLAENAYSNIYWSDVYTEIWNYSANNIIINQQGYKEYRPTHTGSYGYYHYKSSLTPEYKLSLTSDLGQLGVFYREKAYPYLIWKVVKNPFLLEIGRLADYNTVKLSYQGLDLELMVSGFDFRVITGLAARISYSFGF